VIPVVCESVFELPYPLMIFLSEDEFMHGPVVKWVGIVLFVGAAVGMGTYFTQVGLEQADQTASVIGAFIALAGLGLTAYGMFVIRRADYAARANTVASSDKEADGKLDLSRVHHEISGGTFHGPVMQVGDVDSISFGSSQPRPAPPQLPASPAEEGGPG
jgi:hypothetical protein